MGMKWAASMNLGVAEAGFGSYVKIYKPWFIGRDAYIAREEARKGVVVRFRFTEKGVRMAHNGDPVLDRKGRVIGVCDQLRRGQRRLSDRPGVYRRKNWPKKARQSPSTRAHRRQPVKRPPS